MPSAPGPRSAGLAHHSAQVRTQHGHTLYTQGLRYNNTPLQVAMTPTWVWEVDIYQDFLTMTTDIAQFMLEHLTADRRVGMNVGLLDQTEVTKCSCCDRNGVVDTIWVSQALALLFMHRDMLDYIIIEVTPCPPHLL